MSAVYGNINRNQNEHIIIRDLYSIGVPEVAVSVTALGQPLGDTC